ncbi:MAG: hypothetical protein HY653_01515 [Acidobacteria bacterium]|nr:hypothetical protein [Acidobacteriota bacterium]
MSELETRKELIEDFLRAYAGAGLEVSEDGELLMRLGENGYEVRLEAGKLLLHLWSEERTWVRRVAAVEEATAGRLALRVERFGQRRPASLMLATPRAGAAGEVERRRARRSYATFFRRLLQREFPGAKIESLSTASDLKNSFSGLYTRAQVGAGKHWWAVLGVNAREEPATVDGILTYGLIWLDWNRRRHPERVFPGLRLYVPMGQCALTASRLLGLDSSLGRFEVYEVDQQGFTCQPVEPEVANWDTRLLPAAWAAEINRAEESSVARICALEPEVIERVVGPTRPEVSLRVCGLEFARATGGEVFFGVGEQQRLTRQNWAKLETLVRELVRRRVAGGRADDPFYRLQAERWLESVVLREMHTLDPRLDREQLYRQLPAFAAGDRSVVDLLGVTHQGQLVVVELKATTEIHLPLQGLDYWQRVRWLQRRGELESFGYFPAQPLRPDPPELLLVAPAFQFHPTTEMLVRYFTPEIRVTLVGLNEDWRRGLQVVFRKSC